MIEKSTRPSPSGRYSPLRYPGGKGKLARFVADIIRFNRLEDGLYVEPYAGGAAVALELLLTGIVRKIAINDLNFPIYSFWRSVLDQTDLFTKMIIETDVNMETRRKSKKIMMDPNSSGVDLTFATFFLNRTNRSCILNGGVIGGNDQSGPWKLDARYNKDDLVSRINKIARLKDEINLTNLDALFFLDQYKNKWNDKTLIYLDPPYYEKGRDLYYNFYQHGDHSDVASYTRGIERYRWIVSYDDVAPIHALHDGASFLQYSSGYSAREKIRGSEAMFFSEGLLVPPVRGSMIELLRSPQAPANEGADLAIVA